MHHSRFQLWLMMLFHLSVLTEFARNFQLWMMTAMDRQCVPVREQENWDRVHKTQKRGGTGNLPKV